MGGGARRPGVDKEFGELGIVAALEGVEGLAMMAEGVWRTPVSGWKTV